MWRMDIQKNPEGEIILQKEEGITSYKMAAQCGDGGQRLDKKSRGQSWLEGGCEGSWSPGKDDDDDDDDDDGKQAHNLRTWWHSDFFLSA